MIDVPCNDDTIRDDHKLLLYNKYANYYGTSFIADEEPVLVSMVVRSIGMDENSCMLFNEFSNDTYGVTADDLEDIFERGIDDTRISIQEIIEKRLTNYRHILKMRVAHTIDALQPSVCVQYVLVWKRMDHPKIEDSSVSGESLSI